jgi:hypothetical protein
MNAILARYILNEKGYNYALSDVEEACEFLDHPELTEEDSYNYHKWSDPYPRRCYCSVVGYTDKGRFYANQISEEQLKVMKNIFPWFKNLFGEPYESRREYL